MYGGPPRGGSRGGQDQFSWDEIKDSKHRENYLAHSVHAPVGRWAKLRDPTWYYGKTSTAEQKLSEAAERRREIAKVKAQEAEALAEVLGYRPPGSTANAMGLTEQEYKEATKREGALEEDDPDFVKGVGFQTKKGFGSMRDDTSGGFTSAMREPGTGSVPESSTGTRAGDMKNSNDGDDQATSHEKKRKKKKKHRRDDGGDDDDDDERRHRKHKKHKKEERERSRSDGERRRSDDVRRRDDERNNERHASSSNSSSRDRHTSSSSSSRDHRSRHDDDGDRRSRR